MNECYEPLQEVINVIGSQTAVAKICAESTGEKILQPHVWQWLNRDKKIPPRFAKHLEKATTEAGSTVSKERLCPDVFG